MARVPGTLRRCPGCGRREKLVLFKGKTRVARVCRECAAFAKEKGL